MNPGQSEKPETRHTFAGGMLGQRIGARTALRYAAGL